MASREQLPYRWLHQVDNNGSRIIICCDNGCLKLSKGKCVACKHCYQEKNYHTGELVFEADGSPSMLCDIDCLPLRGRLQRLVYASIYESTPISDVYTRVKQEDPNAKDSNIARALSGLKEKCHIVEGEEYGKRVLARLKEFREGYVEKEFYNPIAKVAATSDELRALLCFYIKRKYREGRKWQALYSSDLVEVAALVVDENGDEHANAAEVFETMEPLVKKLRSAMDNLKRNSFPLTETLAKDEGVKDWQGKKVRPVRKRERGHGWQVWVPYFRDAWEQKVENGTMSLMVSEIVREMERRDNAGPLSDDELKRILGAF